MRGAPHRARQGKARQGKARQGKARQGKARQGKAPDVPVIMITAYGDAETKRKALESSADALFTNGCGLAPRS
jgi:CheY-like chemotaxis protein